MLLTSERRDIYLPLDECEIPTDARAKLEALGITTVEELRAYWFYENQGAADRVPGRLAAQPGGHQAARGGGARHGGQGAGRERERAGDRPGASPAAHAARGAAAAIANG